MTMTPALRVLEHDLRYYRQTWRGTITSTFVAPVLFVASLGIGLGTFVDRSGSAVLAGVPYAAFVGPALLMTQAMQAALFENSYPLMGKIEWRRTYAGILATPTTVGQLFAGEVLWLTIRIGVGAVGFFAALVAFGLVRSPSGFLAVPVAILTGLAFALPMYAFTATQKTDSAFSLVFRFIQIPLFLFAGTFFPVERLPGFAQPIAWFTPIANGVAVGRAATLGTLDPSALLHVAVLVAWVGAGGLLAFVALRRRVVV
jgi:lipooligosaccharide transport system permease protein